DLARFLGIFTAEGSVRTNLGQSVLSFGARESELIGFSAKLVSKIFGVNASITRAHKTAVNVVVTSKIVAFVLSKIFGYGHSAKDKIIPEIVFNLSREKVREFLYGYLCGDGCPSELLLDVLFHRTSLEERSLKITAATASEKLAVHLLYLLSALGYSPYIQKKPAAVRLVNGNKAKFGESYIIEFWTKQILSPLNFYPLKEGGVNDVHEFRLKWAVTNRGQQVVLIDKIPSLSKQATVSEDALRFCNSDLRVLQVKEIEIRNANSDEYVYDYSVEGDENFVGGYGPICLHNSFDACEEAGILPDIFVKIDELPDGHVKVLIQDNGPGIPKDYLGKAMGMMLAGTKFHRYMQQRGQQGIGGAGCTLFSQITTGKATKMRSGLGDGKVYECEMKIDVKNNQPVISNFNEFMGNFRGLRIEAEFADVKYDKSEHGVYEYLRRTAMANPHGQITFIEPTGEKHIFPRASDKIPEKPVEIQPHPLGVTTGDLIDMAHRTDSRKLSSFLVNTFSRMSSAKVEELAKLVPTVNFEKNPKDLKWGEAEAIVNAIRTMKWIAPPTDALRPIGSDQIEKALKNILNPEFISVSSRKPKVYRGGVPFMVEAAIAYGGNAGRERNDGTRGGDIIRYANRVPLMFDGGSCAITEAVRSIDWKRYDIKDFENEPVTVFANFVSVHVPYTGTGKQAIVAEDEIVSEIRYAIMEVARDLQIYLRGKIKEMDRETKKKIIMRYVKQLSFDLGELAGVENPSKIEEELRRIIETKYEKIEGEVEEAVEKVEEEVEGEENEKEE
ncbi:MAG: DNA topoisomerase VI subunit B, partial [Candidatus Micrarchaeia archaeon]